MTLELRPATLNDTASLVDIYFAAFAEDEITQAVFPPEKPTSCNFWYDNIIEEMASTKWTFICMYSTSDPHQTPIAFAKWWSQTSIPLPGRQDLPVWPEEGSRDLANHFFGTLVETRKENMGERRHWYLELLATRPEWQGKGAAKRLLKWGLERADEEGVEAYLEASPKGKPVYEKMGFREIGRLVIPLQEGGEEFVECFMLRDAKGIYNE